MNLPLKPVLSKPEEIVIEGEPSQDTESVSSGSDDSMSVLSQSKRKLPAELKRENAVQGCVIRDMSNCEGGKGKDTSEWSILEVKQWVVDTFQSEGIAQNFEDKEIDGRIILSSTVRSNEAMEKLGLNTLGKKGTFLKKNGGTCRAISMVLTTYHLFHASELTLSSAEAVILIWLGKVTITDVHLIQDLKPIAKTLNLKLLRNKDKTTHVRAIASTLLKRGYVMVEVPLGNITRDDIIVKKQISTQV
ncbi:hypothetical protein OS493_019351 [Desmophyllum pertusum]|uniref:SAM domain-containing protein n=1 Tax=Desmophyllum pertusum TaxID=174260 RepID=A0A9X0A182_9CNID|nr:hypothetical protein OS493_019351 [Desmophyllum pertusum]